MTFTPHPNEVIKGRGSIKYIMTLEEKIDKLKSLGVERLYIVPFNMDFASLSPQDFIENYICKLTVKHVVVGFDFTFGFKASGNAKLLGELKDQYDYQLSVIDKKKVNNEKISSTRIRELISSGAVEMIPYYLGNQYSIKPVVQSTEKEGVYKLEVPDYLNCLKDTYYDVMIIQGKNKIPAIYKKTSHSSDGHFLETFGKKLLCEQYAEIKFYRAINEKFDMKEANR